MPVGTSLGAGAELGSAAHKAVFERSPPNYAASFLPGPDHLDADEALRLGLRWLLAQSGEPLILLHARKMLGNNRLLELAAQQYQIPVEALGTLWKSGFAYQWGGGAVLAPWASQKVLDCIDGRLVGRVTAVCVIGWIEGEHDAWVAARGAVDPRGGGPPARSNSELISDPVVRIALDQAARFVNHNNALVQAADKSYVVMTLQELVHGGHPFDIEQIATYAMATGWTPKEVSRIREYGARVLAGRRFQLQVKVDPQPGSCRTWDDEAKAAGA